MARRASLPVLHNSQNQAKELLRLCLTPAAEFPHTAPHLQHSHLQLTCPISKPSTSLSQVQIMRNLLKNDAMFFILNKSYHKIKTLPDLQLKSFLPDSLAVRSHLEVSNSPIARLSAQEEFEINEKTIEFNTKLSELLLLLKTELPAFFEKPHPFSIYSSDLQFDFRYTPLSFKLNSRLQYEILLSSIRSIFKLLYSDLQVDILKITKCQPDYSISTRWRLSGVYRLSLSNRTSVFDAISTFYMNESGLINRHTLERTSKDSRKVPSLAWFFIAVGLYPSELKESSASAVELVSKGKRHNRKSSKQNSHL